METLLRMLFEGIYFGTAKLFVFKNLSRVSRHVHIYLTFKFRCEFFHGIILKLVKRGNARKKWKKIIHFWVLLGILYYQEDLKSHSPQPNLYTMRIPVLRCEPNWYNSDPVPLAFACGALVLGTIFLVEYISAAVLFSKAKVILISDPLAVIDFSISIWFEVFRWVFVKWPARKTERRIWRCSFQSLYRYIDTGPKYNLQTRRNP